MRFGVETRLYTVLEAALKAQQLDSAEVAILDADPPSTPTPPFV